jgi:hypothetical protein
MTALTIVEREAPAPAARDASAARRLRSGDVRPEDLDELIADVERRLHVASPRFLARVGRG